MVDRERQAHVKFKVTLKMPDAVETALGELKLAGHDECDADYEIAEELMNQFFAFGEYVVLEFDTTTETVRVIPVHA